MDLGGLIGPAVIAAVVSGTITLVSNSSSNRSSRKMNQERIASEREVSELKLRAEVDLADRKFGYEKAIHDYRRRVEFAEELLSAFYRLKDIVHSVRNPFSNQSEGETRKRHGPEIEDEARRRDGYYVPVARLQKEFPFISDLMSTKYRAQAIFKGDVAQAFQLATEALNSIQVASGMLIDHVGKPRNDPDFWRGLEREIWETSREKPDEIAQKILKSIEIVEKAVRPTLDQTGP